MEMPEGNMPAANNKGRAPSADAGLRSPKTLALVKSAFKQYYFRHAGSIEAPTRIAEREFGYMALQGAGMTRHLSFKTMGLLLATLVKEVPMDVYCSNAYYRYPTYPMQDKQWLGADLIFDIDGKDLKLPCEQSHSFGRCTVCGQVSEPENSQCGSCMQPTKMEMISVPCKDCIKGSKKEVKRLTSLLTEDLGIRQDEISLYFSGNNGFHIHVRNDAFVGLERDARLDIVSYVMGVGIMTDTLGIRGKKGGDDFAVRLPKGGISYGWRKRMAEGLKVQDVLSIEKLANIVRKDGYHAFKAEFEALAAGMGARIDPQVTSDVHRVFRMPGTVNSKSGLVKARCPDMDSFDPFSDACLLGDEKSVEIDAKCQLRLNLRGNGIKVKKGCGTIPMYAAVYLACKGLAEAV